MLAVVYLLWPIPGYANKVGEVVVKANRLDVISLPLIGRIDELDTMQNPEELKANRLECAGCCTMVDQQGAPLADQGDPLEGFELDCLMYQPLGLHGTYTIEGIDGPEEGQGYGGAVFTVEVTKAMSMFDVMVLVWLWVEAGVWPHTDHVYFESATVYHAVWDETSRHWSPIRVIEFGMGS